jgi:hypothetical protein
VDPRGLSVNPNFPFVYAIVDGYVTETVNGNTTEGIVECKHLLHKKELYIK